MPIQDPLGYRMLVFTLLPSMTLHPSRRSDYASAGFIAALAAMPAHARIWHRHWSRHILRAEGLCAQIELDVAQPGLRLALLPAAELRMLIVKLGTISCAPRLRRAIGGEQVRALRSLLGDDAFSLVHRTDSKHPGFDGPPFETPQQAADEVLHSGEAMLRAALAACSDAVARRACLKLAREELRRCPLDGDDALALALSLHEDANVISS